MASQKIKELEAEYKAKSEARKAKIRQEPKKVKRFFKWVWYIIAYPFIWLFYNMRDPRSAICILISFVIWSGTVWIPALIGLIFRNPAIWAIAGAIWVWWLSPFGSPFIELVIITGIGFKAILNKLNQRREKRYAAKQSTNKDIPNE